MADPVPQLLRRALELIELRQPEAYAGMIACLDGLTVSVAIEGALVLRSEQGRLRELDAEEVPARDTLKLAGDRRAVQELAGGRTTLVRAIREGVVEVAGTIEVLGRGLSALEYFVGALLRIEEAEGLRKELNR